MIVPFKNIKFRLYLNLALQKVFNSKTQFLLIFKDHASVLVDGTCQIPDPVYKLVGSIVCFYIPLGVMLLTYCLTVRLLAQQRQNLGGTPHNSGWASGWLGQTPAMGKL